MVLSALNFLIDAQMAMHRISLRDLANSPHPLLMEEDFSLLHDIQVMPTKSITPWIWMELFCFQGTILKSFHISQFYLQFLTLGLSQLLKFAFLERVGLTPLVKSWIITTTHQSVTFSTPSMM